MTRPTRDDRQQVLLGAAERAARYIAGLNERPVAPTAAAIAALDRLGGALPEAPLDPLAVVQLLDDYGSPATIANAGPRYFGFVTGGALPATLGAAVLATAWDQNAALAVMSPTAAAIEATAGRWVLDLLGLPPESAVGFTTGATMANFTALAAARQSVLARVGWDAAEQGLIGAPPVAIVVGDEVHVSLVKALALVGFGRAQVIRVPVDDQGRMRASAFPTLSGPAIVCLQAGNVNSGAFDPLAELVERAHEFSAWVHIDAAFGLWALASPRFAPLAAGIAGADSWASDAHKWLNVPYDSGLAIIRDRQPLLATMASSAAYLDWGEQRDGAPLAPEMSRRARGVEVWAALRSLGRAGLAELVERCCRLARRFADGLGAAGFDILNDVVLNQVLVAFGDAERTRAVIDAVQRDGTCWCGGTVWQGRAAMRISVSSWATSEADIDRSLAAVVRIAEQAR